jgi:hypothetical protein
MTAQTRIEARALDQRNIVGRVAVGLLLALLLYRAALFASGGLAAILFPWELDYGEGIVWQQMRWIFTAKAYGPIDQFPAIVFHYPPLYHAVTAITAGMLGTDELATGRAISLLATLAAAVASAMLAGLLLEGRAGKGDRRLGGLLAGLLVFTYLPVTEWAILMRVDMLAIALGLFGLVAAFKALERPRLIWAASLLFVAAVYTKQTAIAAPAATFAVLALVRPRLAMQGIAICMAVGTAILLTLGWLTDGGFYRHIFLYNVNRPDLGRLWWVYYVAAGQAAYVLLAGFVLLRRLAEVRSKYGNAPNLRLALGGNVADIRLLIAAGYFLITTLMLVLVAKSGSSINYFLEWFFALGLFAAMALSEAGSARSDIAQRTAVIAIGIPIALAIEVITSPPLLSDLVKDPARTRDLSQLSGEVASSAKPVISDDMVLLVRSGQDVLWEPAIFAELASTGDWDERPFVERIRNGEFAFFITWGQRGDERFAERYNPAVADAIDQAYPIKEEKAGLVVHRPRIRAAVEKAPTSPPPALRLKPTQR